MISSEKLTKMARKWQRLAALRRNRISFPRASREVKPINKGHFVVYTADDRRFVFPIVYLNTEIFRELLKLSEEEFGLPTDGPITLPCDAAFVSFVQHNASKDTQKALLLSMANSRCSFPHSLHQEQT